MMDALLFLTAMIAGGSVSLAIAWLADRWRGRG